MYKRKRDFKYAAPALGIYTFVLVIFATFTTRAGGIWQSVHAFGSADVNQSAWDRFWEVTTSDGIILGYFLLMMIIAIGGTILLIWALVKRGGLDENLSESPDSSPLNDLINDKSLMFLTLIVLVITTIITLILLILAINGADRLQFDSKVGLFTMVGVAVLAVCLSWKLIGRTISFFLLMGVSVIATVLIILQDRTITTEQLAQYVAWITVAFGILALGACIYKIIVSINRKSLRGSINAISPHLVHLGVVLLVIGFVGSNFLVSENEISLSLNGPAQKVGDYEYRMVDGEFSSGESIFVTIEILKDGNKIGEGRPGAIFIDEQWRNEISVVSQIQEDIYIVFIDGDVSGSSVTRVDLTVKTLPWMILLWSGMWLLAIGLVIRLIVDYTRPKINVEKRVEKRARMRESEEKDEDYYEDLIEKELKELE
jgi:cytochrome c biogenesis factor